MTTDVNVLVSIEDYEWYPILDILQYCYMT